VRAASAESGAVVLGDSIREFTDGDALAGSCRTDVDDRFVRTPEGSETLAKSVDVGTLSVESQLWPDVE
jgi:hypothetical protein